MRNGTNRSRFSMAIAAALGIFVMTLGTPAHALGSAVSVVSSSVSGGIVNVTVKNNSFLPQVATVKVQAVVSGTAVWSLVPVVLLPGQTAVAHAGFTASVSNLLTVGVVLGMTEDGLPF